jgi:hypothetical protein
MSQYEVRQTFVRLARRSPGVLYEPIGLDDETLVTVLVMHSDEDYLSSPTGTELAMRGFRVLCANPMVKEGLFFSQIDKMQSVKCAVEYLRSRPNARKIILMGHSGGATLMTAYQAVAENGPKVFQGAEKIYPYPDSEPLPPADGIMLLDSNWGNAAMQLFSLDPAVADESGGVKLNSEYNLFEPSNGFNPDGSAFPDEFIARFQKRQGERNNAVLNYALSRLEAIQSGHGDYADDEPLIIPGANQVFFNNKLYAQDVRLMSHTEEPQLLLHGDGTRTREIVHSLRKPENNKSLTHLLGSGARIMTVRNYLSSYAVRTLEDYRYDDSTVRGIDWDSSYACPPGNVRHINAPILIMGMTAGWEYLASETIYNKASSADKTLAFVEGASHTFNTEHRIEKYPGQYGDTMKTMHDYIAEWLTVAERFND